MVALPLGRHRVGLRKRDSTFTTGRALAHLQSLRLCQSNRRISPDNPTLIITTKAVTTFTMAPHIARSLCNRFLAARFVESCDSQTEFQQPDKVWQLTPKGISLLQSFAYRRGVQDHHVFSVIESPRNTMRLLVLERDSETDELIRDPATLEVIFRRFVGMENLNTQNGTSSSDTDSVNECQNGVLGVKQSQRKIGTRLFPSAFTGKAAIDWLMNCCSLADEREAEEILSLFQKHQFIVCLKDARTEEQKVSSRFQFSKSCIHMVTDEGSLLVRGAARHQNTLINEAHRSQGAARDSNASRMVVILSTPSLRLLFREFLRDTHCEENLVFFMEVKDLLARWDSAMKRQSDATAPTIDDTIRETMAAAYGKPSEIGNYF